MKTVEVKIFEIDELPENIRKKIVCHWRDNDDFYWLDEWEETLKAFFQHFSGEISLRDWSWCSYRGSNISFEVCENLQTMSGVRLFKYLANNHGDMLAKWDYCQLTGFIGDYDILEPIADFMKRPSLYVTFEDLIRECFEAWSIAVQKDYEYWLSEESILEDISANDIKFTQDGSVWH